MRFIAAALIALLFALPADAQAPECHPLGKGLSSVDMDGNVVTECWPLLIVGNVAADH